MTLVLLPGMDGTGRLFEPFVAALRSEFDVRVVRYPGTEPLDYAGLESLARAELPVDGPFVILGESFSGPIAVSIGASAPARLKGLILCCTFVSNPRPALSALRPLVGMLPTSFVPTRVLSHLLLGRFVTSALRIALAEAMAGVSPSALRARLRAVLSVDVSAELASVELPVLYLRASRDRLVPADASARVAALSPHARISSSSKRHTSCSRWPRRGGTNGGRFRA